MADPDPGLARLGDRDLYVGDERAADPDAGDRHDAAFEHVLSVAARATDLATHHHPLVDGRVNDQAAFDAAVDAARDLHCRPGPLLIHCAAGVSRSAAVAATAVAAEEDRPLEEAIAIVQEHRPVADPHPGLRQNARAYLGEPRPGEGTDR